MSIKSQHKPMSDNILSSLELTPADVPALSAKARDSLITYLLRWGHYHDARRCLQQLVITHSHLVSVYDSLARVHLALEDAGRALEIMRRRHNLGVSNSSQALEARAHLAAGDHASAQAIARKLTDQHPHMLLAWSLHADVCLATGDLDGAEAALQQRETLQPETASTALGLARLWQAQGDAEKALLWARAALSRIERDERQPSIELLRLLEGLYRATGQPAQAGAIATRLQQRQQQDLENLRQALGLTLPVAEPQPTPQRTVEPTFQPEGAIIGAVDLTADERACLDDALHHHFAHDAFRPGQADAIAAILRGESALAIMPTGAGKSLCYQLAALLLPGTTLIVSPLIALMKDQLDGLPASVAAQATTLNSTLSSAELEARLARAADGGYKLLYAAPERLRQRPFLHTLKKAGVSLLVVDEAHCVSLWGHDFRPDYLFIAKAWRELGQPPILAMTATATPRVRDDIQAALGKKRLVATDVHRPNLRLEARPFANDKQKKQALLALCREIEGSGIIYANARRKCEDLAEMLRRNGVTAIHYHAGIKDRAAVQDFFMRDRARIVVATIAFGMGVDKADVRFIIHYNPPKALENYYQEAGRAGRDALPARCILFHTPSDKGNLTRWTRQDALHVEFLRRVYAAIQHRVGDQGVGLVTVADLERDLVADDTQVRVAVHFLETAGLLWRGFDLPRTARLTLSRPSDRAGSDLARFVEIARLRPGQTVSRDLVTLSHDAGLDPRTIETQLMAWDDAGWLRYRGIGRDMLLALPQAPSDSRQRVAAMLADYRAGQDGRIAEMMAYATTRRCRHGYISAYFGGRPIERCQACDNCLRRTSRRPASTHQPQPIQDDEALAERLRAWRKEIARQDGAVSYVVLPNATLAEIAAQRPATMEALGAIKGMGPKRLDRYGPAILALLDSPSPPSFAPPPDPGPAKERPQVDIPTDYDESLFEQLRAWRLQVAHEIAKPPYIIFHDVVLKRIAASRPRTLEELLAIKGVGPHKLEQYGPAVLAISQNE